MKISIIVPIYNVEKEIIRCLRSVVEQSYSDIELIIVNDCSLDNSYQIALDFLREQGFLSQTLCLEHDFNKGLSEARNTGLSIATGDYIFFLDSDDKLSDVNAVAQLVSIARSYQYPDLVFGGHQRITETETLEIPHIKKDVYQSNSQLYSNYASVRKILNDYAWGKLINKKFLLDNNLFFEKGLYFEDTLWGFNLYRKVNSMIIAPYIIYNYYLREGSITSSVTEKHVSDFNSVIELMYKELKLNPNYYPLITQREIERRRRENIGRMLELTFFDKTYIYKEINRLKKIKLSCNPPLFRVI